MGSALRYLPAVWLGLAILITSVLSSRASISRSPVALQKIYLFPYTHLDLGYSDAPETLAVKYQQVIDHVLDYIDANPDVRWSVESTWQLEQWLERTPDRARVRHFFDRVREGRILVSASYANLHQTYGHEEANRQFFYSAQLGHSYGFTPTVAFFNDVAGYSGYLPQALAASSVPYALVGANQLFGTNETIPRRNIPFWWQGPDGSRTLTYIALDTYAEGIFGWRMTTDYATFASQAELQLQRLRDADYPFDILGLNFAFDNFDLTFQWFDAVRRNIAEWNARHTSPQFVLATPDQYFREIEARYGPSLATYRGDWSGLWEEVKQLVPTGMAAKRWAADHQTAAEKLSSLNTLWSGGAVYPSDSLFYATQGQLLTDEHNNIGWFQRQVNSAEILNGNRQHAANATEARDAVQRALAGGLAGLSRQLRSDGPGLFVFNALSWSRTDLAKVALDPSLANRRFLLRDLASGASVPYDRLPDNQIAFIARDVPSLGYRRYALELDKDPPPPLSPTGPDPGVATPTIENESYRVTVDPGDGRILSLYDKQANRELVNTHSAFGFNRLILATGDAARAIKPGPYQPAFRPGTTAAGAPTPPPVDPASSTGPAVIPQEGDGGDRPNPAVVVPSGAVTVERPASAIGYRLVISRPDSPHTRTEIALYPGLPRLDLAHTLNRDKMRRVSLLTGEENYYLPFPWALSPSGLKLRWEGPNSVNAPPDDYLPGANLGSYSVQHFVDLREAGGYGVTVAQRQAFLDTIGGIGRWASQFAPKEATLMSRLLAKADEVDTKDQGVIKLPYEPDAGPLLQFDYSIHSGMGLDPIALDHQGWEWNLPLLGGALPAGQPGPLSKPSQSFFAVDQPNVVIQTIKRADFGNGFDLIFRFREIAGQARPTVRLISPYQPRSASRTTLLEADMPGFSLYPNPLSFSIGAREVVTVRARYIEVTPRTRMPVVAVDG